MSLTQLAEFGKLTSGRDGRDRNRNIYELFINIYPTMLLDRSEAHYAPIRSYTSAYGQHCCVMHKHAMSEIT